MTEPYKYRMIVYWSAQDNVGLVEVPDLPGAMADGVTPEEAVEMAQEVIKDWLAVAQMDGRSIPEPQECDALSNV